MKKNLFATACVGILLLSACAGKSTSSSETALSQQDTLTMLVGSYAAPEEEGIKLFKFNQETGEALYISGLSGISNPSFLTFSADGTKVYTVGEDETAKTSTANALTLDTKTMRLSLLNSQSTQGGAPCHISLSPDSHFVITANYMGGNITVFPLDKSGKLEEGDVISFEGKGPDNDRQSQPHLHHIYFTPDHKCLLANDLGTDKIHAFPLHSSKKQRHNELLDKQAAFDIPLKAGSGPRHACFDPQGKFAYLLTELSGEVIVLSYDGQTLTPVQTIQADTVGAQGSADIHLSPDGKYLYASNRLKADGIAIFKVDVVTGLLTKAGYQLTGIHPRNFILTPNGKYLLVACRDSNEIQVYLRNAETGLLQDTGKRIPMEKPVCIQWHPTGC